LVLFLPSVAAGGLQLGAMVEMLAVAMDDEQVE
jgi:hypothetical protein